MNANKAFLVFLPLLPITVSAAFALGLREAFCLFLGFLAAPVFGHVRRRFRRWRVAKLARRFLADAAIPTQAARDLADKEPHVVQVTPKVHVAINFGLANSILIIGDDGCIIVDTMESYVVAKEVYREFRKITPLPVKTIILTHCHQDHCHGTNAFMDEEEEAPEVWAHAVFEKEFHGQCTGPRSCFTRRACRQLGLYLPEEQKISCGIGPKIRIRELSPESKIVKPTHLVQAATEERTFAGVRVVFLHIPGESNDQMGVWLPDLSVLIPADNIYKAFPNLYAIRGDPQRDLSVWVASLDKMRNLKPEHLVPCHTEPLSGQSTIFDTMTIYRDAIQYVHDQTVRRMNEGLDLDDIVEKVKLPQTLREHPYLQEYYGTVEWSVRAVYYQKVGWYNQPARELFPLLRRDRAEMLMRLAGTRKVLERIAREYRCEGRYSECIEIADCLLALDPSDDAAMELYCDALKLLASKQTSMNARNYLLTSALEAKGLVDVNLTLKQFRIYVSSISVFETLKSMSCMIMAEALNGSSVTFNYVIMDDNSSYHVVVRNCVWTAHSGLSDTADATLRIKRKTWFDILERRGFVPLSVARGDLKLEGNVKKYVNFFATAFTPPVVWNQLED